MLIYTCENHTVLCSSKAYRGNNYLSIFSMCQELNISMFNSLVQAVKRFHQKSNFQFLCHIIPPQWFLYQRFQMCVIFHCNHIQVRNARNISFFSVGLICLHIYKYFFHVFAFLTEILVVKQLSFLYRHLLHWLLDLTLDHLCRCLISILLKCAFSLCPFFRELSVHFLLVLFQFIATVVLACCPCPEHAGLFLSANLLSNNSVVFVFGFVLFLLAMELV